MENRGSLLPPEVCEGYVFTPVCQSFCSQGRGWYPSMHCRSPGPHPGGKLRDLAWGSPGPHPGGSPDPHRGGVSRHTPRGVSRPTPGGSLQAHTWGEVSRPHLGGPGPHPGGISRPTPRGRIPACTEADTH